uniref:Uncharacterized protein n=1 Tax=Rhodosorus marinus TaxID=101924 RepID=A0A7S2ZKN4_9RHOD|mmetsp:Transcript_21724/g.88571  ORF Transcript_21724/g.88571 Transcript_21724/m.88571 type:complete len:236 (+) Transcript_21724:90-797(+)
MMRRRMSARQQVWERATLRLVGKRMELPWSRPVWLQEIVCGFGLVRNSFYPLRKSVSMQRFNCRVVGLISNSANPGYALSAWVVASSSLSSWAMDPAELRRFHLSEDISELAAWGWFCSLIVTRLAYWIYPCHGKGLQSSLEAVFTLSFTSFSFAYVAVAPKMIIPATSTALLFLSSSWTFMVASFKVARMPPGFTSSPPGKANYGVRENPNRLRSRCSNLVLPGRPRQVDTLGP